MNEKLTRRNFMKGAAIATAGIAASALPISAAAAELPKKWDREADVVVIGAGGAGLMAAIQAHDAGANVLVINKGKSVFHSATRMCGGLFTAAGTKIQKKEGVKDSPEQFAKDVLAYGGYMNFPDVILAWAKKSGEAFDWLADRGLAKYHLENYAGHTNKRAIRQAAYTGRDYVDVLDREFTKRKIKIEPSTPVKRYFYDEKQQRIAGVEAEGPKGSFTVKAKKGVILCSGGYTGDARFLDSWVPSVAGAGVAIGADTNDGNAMMCLVRDLGIPITHMQYIASYPWGVVTNGRNGVACRFQYFAQAGGILVNKKGKRFISEETGLTKISVELPKQEEKCHFLFADQQAWDETFKKYAPGTLFSMPAWSKERIDSELKAGKVLFTGNTIDEVAKKAGIPAKDLNDTVKTYNQYVVNKNDPDFRRQNLPRQIGKGPYYMVRMSFWNNLSLGGVRVNSDFQIEDVDGNPIKGLYAAGEVVGGIHGAYYCGGNAISWCHTSGYVCGKNAAKG